MRRTLLGLIGLSLIIGGCGFFGSRYKYDILRSQTRIPNPPQGKIRVVLKGGITDAAIEALTKDVVPNCYRSLKGPEVVTPENASFQKRQNPFMPVGKDEPHDLEIVGKITTDHSAQKGGGAGESSGEEGDELGSQRLRPLNFMLKVTDAKTNAVIFEESFTKMFPPSQSNDGEMMTAIFLGFILNGGII